jgi:hypothetical protein
MHDELITFLPCLAEDKLEFHHFKVGFHQDRKFKSLVQLWMEASNFSLSNGQRKYLFHIHHEFHLHFFWHTLNVVLFLAARNYQ